MPYPAGKHTVAGLEVTYSEAALIDGQHVSVVRTEFVTADSVKEFFETNKLYNPAALGASFHVALNCAMASSAELIRIVNLMDEHTKKGK